MKILLTFLTLISLSYGKHFIRHDETLREFYHNTKDPYFEGDSKEQATIDINDLPKIGEMFEGDMVMDNDLRHAALGLNNKRSATVLAEVGKKKHWPKGIVPYVIRKGTLRVIKRQIHLAIEEFKALTCVKYIPRRPGDTDYVEFSSDAKSCSSSVGRVGGKQLIHLAYGCKRIGTVMHEMMHAIGIIHEQSRSDRDDNLIVKFDNIEPKLTHNFRKYDWFSVTDLDVPYNYWSVMHYSNNAFSSNGEPTLISKYDKSLKFGQRVQLSHSDVKQINNLYPCDKKIDDSTLVSDMTADVVIRNKRNSVIDEEEYDRIFRDYQ